MRRSDDLQTGGQTQGDMCGDMSIQRLTARYHVQEFTETRSPGMDPPPSMHILVLSINLVAVVLPMCSVNLRLKHQNYMKLWNCLCSWAISLTRSSLEEGITLFSFTYKEMDTKHLGRTHSRIMKCSSSAYESSLV